MDIISETANIIKRDFNKSILMIDNLDKSSEMQMEVVQRFFSGIQGFVEHTFSINKIQLVIVGPLFWIGQAIESTPEFSYISDTPIRMHKWRQEDIEKLISNRLQKYYVRGDYSLNKFFSQDAIGEIFNRCNGNPRYCINAAGRSLFQGWKDNASLITSKFFLENPDCVVGSLVAIETKTYHDLSKLIERDQSLRISLNKLSSFISNNKAISKFLIDDIFELYSLKNIEIKEFKYFKILFDDGLVQIDNSPSLPKTKKFCYLEPNIKKLVKIVLDEFDSNDKRAKNYLMHKFGI